jgi:hypothetical protein
MLLRRCIPDQGWFLHVKVPSEYVLETHWWSYGIATYTTLDSY